MRTRLHFIHIDQIGYTNEKVAELQKQKLKKEKKMQKIYWWSTKIMVRCNHCRPDRVCYTNYMHCININNDSEVDAIKTYIFHIHKTHNYKWFNLKIRPRNEKVTYKNKNATTTTQHNTSEKRFDLTCTLERYQCSYSVSLSIYCMFFIQCFFAT